MRTQHITRMSLTRRRTPTMNHYSHKILDRCRSYIVSILLSWPNFFHHFLQPPSCCIGGVIRVSPINDDATYVPLLRNLEVRVFVLCDCSYDIYVQMLRGILCIIFMLYPFLHHTYLIISLSILYPTICHQ